MLSWDTPATGIHSAAKDQGGQRRTPEESDEEPAMSPNTMLSAEERRRGRRHCADPTESRLSPRRPPPLQASEGHAEHASTTPPRRGMTSTDAIAASRRKSCKIFIRASHLTTPPRVWQHRPRSFTPPPPQHFTKRSCQAESRRPETREGAHRPHHQHLADKELQPSTPPARPTTPTTAIAHSKG